ncbi:MAG: ferredoxin [Thermodesulfobacteriota bacterium]
MQPYVDQELCIGCGNCAELCPEVFELRDDKSWVIGPDKCGSCDCQATADACPAGAISLR